MRSYTKLNQLTALRFFAAIMIVIHHFVGVFGVERIWPNLDHGVSFFFVLSGFILTYAYPKLENMKEIGRFWRARLARIYPIYFFCFILGFVLVPFNWDTRTAIPYLFMIQSLIPDSTYYFSYDAVSWSISTEFFFYAVFPILIYKWDKTWMLKFILSGTILVFWLYIINCLNFSPHYQPPHLSSDKLFVTAHGLIYVNPVSRIFEFVLGMTTAKLWSIKNSNNTSTRNLNSLYEMAAILLCVISMYYGHRIVQLGQGTFLGSALVEWLIHCSSLFSFSFLIYVMASGSGIISRFLSTSFWVVLGESSFSMYLIHTILLAVYNKNSEAFSDVPTLIMLPSALMFLLICSYLMWRYIEVPFRKFLLGNSPILPYFFKGASMEKGLT